MTWGGALDTGQLERRAAVRGLLLKAKAAAATQGGGVMAPVEGVAWQREVIVGFDFSIISLLPSLYLPHGPCLSHHILIAALAVGLSDAHLGSRSCHRWSTEGAVGESEAAWGAGRSSVGEIHGALACEGVCHDH